VKIFKSILQLLLIMPTTTKGSPAFP
jgi:hypothetical protein